MDPLQNPFTPGAGTLPPMLAGRKDLLEQVNITMKRGKLGKYMKSFVLTGLRGVGKTVILNNIELISESQGFFSVYVEIIEHKSLPEMFIPRLRQILIRLDRSKRAGEYAKKALRVLAAFASAVHVTIGELEFGLDVEPEFGTADSGDLEADFSEVMEAVGVAAKEKEATVALIIDELQYLDKIELSALIMALHRIAQKSLPIVMFGAALPNIITLAGQSKSYTERIFDFPSIGALSREETIEAVVEPIKAERACITTNAVDVIYEMTEGYPYFVQTWAYYAWNVSNNDEIGKEDVLAANELAEQALEQGFFMIRLERLTPNEQNFVFAMAELGPGPHRNFDVAKKLRKAIESVSQVRTSLNRKGIIFTPSIGEMNFTVPMFDKYLRRILEKEY